MKPLVIYHDTCADGFGAAFAAWMKFGDEAEYRACQYGADQHKTLDGFLSYYYDLEKREVYILDFSFPKETMNWVFQVAKKVVWLDHHKSAFEMWCGMVPDNGMWREDNWHDGETPKSRYILLDNNKSGAMLTWEYFQLGREVPMLIKHIDDYDRWQFKLEGTKEFNKALWSYAPWDFKQWQSFLTQETQSPYSAHYSSFLNEGAAILRAHDQNVQAVVKGAALRCSFDKTLGYEEKFKTEQWQDNLDGLAANCPPHLASDVGSKLASQSGTYGLTWYINKEGKCLCSLRSVNTGSATDYDVSAIAKAFGGGGHKNAAGFEIDIQTLLKWIK